MIPELNSDIKQAKIVVVDDNSANLDLLRDVLELEGYRDIVTIEDPFVAEALLKEESPALVILDIRMPGLDGIELMKSFRKACTARGDYPSTLVMTAQKDPETRHDALSAGARDFITKPFDAPELLQRVHNMLETRLLYDRQKDQAKELEREVAKRTKSLDQKSRDLEAIQLDIVERLGRIGEYRDNETGHHVTRVGLAAKLVAEKLGLSDEFVKAIEKAAPLHDLGKVAVPDLILHKPGQLTAEQWQVIKTHTTVGADLLGGIESPLMKMAKSIANYHHERWDGGGYPDGLEGKDIPIEARIVAVADVFDALCSERPYKEAWTEEKAVAYLKANAGSQFDADVVEAFITSLEKIRDMDSLLRTNRDEPKLKVVK